MPKHNMTTSLTPPVLSMSVSADRTGHAICTKVFVYSTHNIIVYTCKLPWNILYMYIIYIFSIFSLLISSRYYTLKLILLLYYIYNNIHVQEHVQQHHLPPVPASPSVFLYISINIILYS